MGVDVAHETPYADCSPTGFPDGVATDILVLSDAAAAGRKAEAVSHALTAGIAEVTDRMVSGDFKLNEVLHQVLETMYRALDLQRIVFCLRDARTDCMTGRLALGLGGQGACKPFVIPLREPPGAAVDLFAAVCRKGADTVIADTGRGGMANRLPAWYLEGVNAPSFLLLPLMLRNAPFGLIYADVAQAGGLAPEEKELALLRALRNQVVMAFRQVGV
jgi:hypothetical protein